MWSSENERLGFKNCSPFGYFLMQLAFVLFVATLIFLVAAVGMIVMSGFSSGISLRLLLPLILPVGTGLAGLFCHRAAQSLVAQRGFVYDYSSDQCNWDNM